MLLTFIEKYPFILAFLLGLIPAFIWLWFWLKEDRHPEPHKMITLAFLGGMLSVVLVLPFQKIVYEYIHGGTITFVLWATLEELFKFGTVYYIALRNKATDEPVDDMIYLIVSALGFVALENTLFLVDPIHSGDFVGTIVTGNLRFIGASLLHTMSSATIGVFMAISYYKNNSTRRIYLACGLILAITLHTLFNLFIIQQSEGHIFLVFGSVWVGVITLMLLFEKVQNDIRPKVQT